MAEQRSDHVAHGAVYTDFRTFLDQMDSRSTLIPSLGQQGSRMPSFAPTMARSDNDTIDVKPALFTPTMAGSDNDPIDVKPILQKHEPPPPTSVSARQAYAYEPPPPTPISARQATPSSVRPISVRQAYVYEPPPPIVSARGAYVSSEELSVLVASYHIYFAEWSRHRKRVSKQKVPRYVWVRVYGAYLKKYPNSYWKEDTLKERLTRTLKELDTSTSNIQDSNNTVLQPDDVLQQLKRIDGDATRCNNQNSNKTVVQPDDVLEKLRVIHGHTTRCELQKEQETNCKVQEQQEDSRAPSSSSSDLAASSSSSDLNSPSDHASPHLSSTLEKDKPLSKSELLAEQSKGIAAIAAYWTDAKGPRQDYMSAKTESERCRSSMFRQKERSLRIADLFRLKDAGVYSHEEFIVESKKVMDS